MKYFIYFIYNNRGLIHSYIPEFLNRVRDQYDVIHVVFNGTLAPGQRDRLSMADEITERSNDGFDVGAYKAAIFSNPDDFYAKECEEVTLANFTFFAHAGLIDSYFEWVNANRDGMDIWGPTAHKAMTPNPFTGEGTLPYHIQSHWISVGKRVLENGDFIRYWRELPDMETYTDSVLKHESKFTQWMQELGHSAHLYFDDGHYESAYPAFNDVDEAIEFGGLPILKRRLFYHEPVTYFDHYDVNLRRAMQHVERHNLLDRDSVLEAVKDTDPYVLHQTTDNLTVVPDELYGLPDDPKSPIPAILVWVGPPQEDGIAQTLGAVRAPLDVTLYLVSPLPNGAEERLKEALPHLAGLQLQSGGLAQDGTLSATIDAVYVNATQAAKQDNQPILFGVVDGSRPKPFLSAIRHLCADASVAHHARAEIARSPHSGLGVAPIAPFGAPSEIDMLTPDMVDYYNSILLELDVISKPEGPMVMAPGPVVWVRPSILVAFAELAMNRAVEVSRDFDDMLDGQTPDIDPEKIDVLLTAGLPFIARDAGFITMTMSNTAEISRLFVKAEHRLRLVSSQIKTDSPFSLEHKLNYLARYDEQSDREAIFSSVHQSAFNLGWERASKEVWSRAFIAGQNAEIQRFSEVIDVDSDAIGDLETVLREKLAERKQVNEAEVERQRREIYDGGFNEGWRAADEARSESGDKSAHDKAFDKGYKVGWKDAKKRK